MAHWTDILGNQVDAQEANAEYETGHKPGESVSDWMHRMADEMFPADDNENVDYEDAALSLLNDLKE